MGRGVACGVVGVLPPTRARKPESYLLRLATPRPNSSFALNPPAATAHRPPSTAHRPPCPRPQACQGCPSPARELVRYQKERVPAHPVVRPADVHRAPYCCRRCCCCCCKTPPPPTGARVLRVTLLADCATTARLLPCIYAPTAWFLTVSCPWLLILCASSDPGCLLVLYIAIALIPS